MNCKLCQSPARELCRTAISGPKTTQLIHAVCSSCGTVFVANTPDDEELAHFYGSIDQGAHYDEIESVAGDKQLEAVEMVQKLCGGTDPYVLDLGTGLGRFPRRLRDAGFANVAAHELPVTDLSELIADGFTVYQDTDYSSLPDDEFDVVTLLDVVEHVRDPQHLFESVHRCLKPGGLVYFHVPVVSRLDRAFHGLLRLPGADRIGKIWQQGRTSVYHLQNYTPPSLDKLMAEAGFGDTSLEVANELSWPIEKYVRIYFVERLGLPQAVGAPASQVFGPLLKSDYLNANKAIAWGRKPS